MIMKTLICKIPPNLPLPKGGIMPLFRKGARGDLRRGDNHGSIQK
jgi:hypothetical protein